MKYTRKQRATRSSLYGKSRKSGGKVSANNVAKLIDGIDRFGEQFVGNIGSRPWNKANTKKNQVKHNFKNTLTNYLTKVIAPEVELNNENVLLSMYKKNDIIQFYKNNNKTTKYTGKVIEDPTQSNGDFKYKVQITKIGNNSPAANMYNTITSKNIVPSD